METPSVADTYVSIPELMRLARGTYKRAVDIQLAAAHDLDDFPTSSGFVLSYLLEGGEGSVVEKVEVLGIKRRDANQLVDTLVLRGYLTREIDPTDGAVSFVITERGHAANDAVVAGCEYVDAELASRLSETEMAGLRRGLEVLGEIKRSLQGPVIPRGLPKLDD